MTRASSPETQCVARTKTWKRCVTARSTWRPGELCPSHNMQLMRGKIVDVWDPAMEPLHQVYLLLMADPTPLDGYPTVINRIREVLA